MLLINKQSPWVLHLFNQMIVWLETISQHDNFGLISKVTHLPDQSNIKIQFKMATFWFSEIHYIFRLLLFSPKLQYSFS